jgi:hypothetical protein
LIPAGISVAAFEADDLEHLSSETMDAADGVQHRCGVCVDVTADVDDQPRVVAGTGAGGLRAAANVRMDGEAGGSRAG